MPAVSSNGLVVVTGITGYIGSHVGLAALQAGLRVRGTVRSLEKGKDLPAALEKQGADISKLEIVVLDDLSSEEQFVRVLEGAEGIAHVAMNGGAKDLVKAIVDSDVALIRAATKVPSVKRIVLTSSSVASRHRNDVVDHALSGDSWNDAAVEEYQKLKEDEPRSWVLQYSAGKTLAERAARKLIAEQKPGFDLVTILPNTNFGPLIYGKPHSTAGWVSDLYQGKSGVTNDWPVQWVLDVRDDARVHVLALTTESLGGKRFWAVAEPGGWNQVLGILRKHFPNGKFPEDLPGEKGDIDKQVIDNSLATELVGSWIGIEKSLVETGKAFGF